MDSEVWTRLQALLPLPSIHGDVKLPRPSPIPSALNLVPHAFVVKITTLSDILLANLGASRH